MRKSFRKKIQLTVAGITATSMILCSVQTWAAESPLIMIRTTVEQSMAILENPAYQGDAKFTQRIKKIEEIVLPRLDSVEFGRRCLGVHWQKLNTTQQQEFISLFRELIEKSYGGMLDRYPAGVRFSYDEERIDGKFAEVHTRVHSPTQNTPLSVAYKLHQKEGRWLIYDVVAENISMVRNYRNQFGRILNKSSYDELTQTLRKKIRQLETAPAS